MFDLAILLLARLVGVCDLESSEYVLRIFIPINDLFVSGLGPDDKNRSLVPYTARLILSSQKPIRVCSLTVRETPEALE